MIYVTFVCLGNICRSPMAEIIFKKMLEDNNLEGKFCVTSRATSDEEEGAPIYYPALKELNKRGLNGSHRATVITFADIKNNDYILVMDRNNLADVMRLATPLYSHKVRRLCDFTLNPRDVADPWYSRSFDIAYEDIYDGCSCFLKYLQRSGSV